MQKIMLSLLILLAGILFGYIGVKLTRDEKEIYDKYFNYLLPLVSALAIIFYFIEMIVALSLSFIFIVMLVWRFVQ
jgi:hypothetical protein